MAIETREPETADVTAVADGLTVAAATARMAELTARYDPADEDFRQYDNAIARRNTTWAYYEAAADLLRSAERRYGTTDSRTYPFRQNYNQAQQDWEHAVRDLVRERVRFQMARGLHWSQRALTADGREIASATVGTATGTPS